MRRMPLSKARDRDRKRLARLEWLSTPRDFQQVQATQNAKNVLSAGKPY